MTEAELKQIVDEKNAAEMTEATKPADPMESEKVQIAAGYYAKLCKTIRGYSGNMKAGGLNRVMVALAEFPYGDTYPKFRSDAEQELFTYMLTIQSAKAVIAEALRPELANIETAAVDGIVKEEVDKITEKQKGEG